ncbi:MAG: (Fe-S)-binding protein [Bacteroidetes bacterium]|nr:(Fe-S)-binding protein [Bacteroidota bacterium]
MNAISDDLLTQCMHCGLCLPVCPTYALTGLERSSPRGRIRLMKSVMEGKIPLSDAFVEEMNFCLDCQACETACPAGVKYGELVESARVFVDEQRKGFNLKRFVLRKIVVRKGALRLVARVTRFYQASRIEKVVLGVLRLFSRRLYNRAKLLPRISKEFAIDVLPEVAEPKENARGTVAVLTGCVMDVFYAGVNRDTVDVLLENGWRVAVPQDQVCCGSLNAHNGDSETPKALARKNIEVFEKSGAEYYVINSAGCGAFMKQYGEILADDAEFAERAKRFSSKVKDFSEFLYQTGYKKPEAHICKSTVYHEACHLVHAQRVSAEPKSIVKELSGNEFHELNEATWCCGSAGIYNVVRYEDASKLLDRKMKNIKDSGAEVVVTGNPGCMAQIGAGAKNEKLDIEAVHPATVLNRLYKSGKI